MTEPMTEMDELAVRDEVDRSNCFARAMERWHASRKRPDLTDEDRVRGALQAYERQAFANELRRASLSPAGVTEEQVEAAARAIYAQQPNYGLGVRPNTSGGWSPARFDDEWEDAPDRHDDCRRQARAALEAAAKVQPSISTGQGEPVEWCCSKCGCRSHARVDERQSDGSFAPGSRVRCVHCKDVSYFPSLPAGHVAVPVEPTEEMIKAGLTTGTRFGPKAMQNIYCAMLSAIPHNQGEGK